jgi:ring-1,2-phenylacetyl-CoA epoxidase subunit PaaE
MMAGVGRSVFHPLQVAAIDPLTDDAVAITFDVPAELAADFAFEAGQHVTLRCVAAGDDARRTYSLCSRPGVLRIGVRQVAGGVFSRHALTALKIGDEVEVMPPRGRFVSGLDNSLPRHRGGIVAGSGVTPVLSIVASTLESEPSSTFTLIYANRTVQTVMFLDDLADLKDRFPNRLAIFHVLSREARESPLLSGRLDRAKLRSLLDTIGGPPIDEWFVCGPHEFTELAGSVLHDRGVDDAVVHRELFYLGTDESPHADNEPTSEGATSAVTMILAGRSTELTVPVDGDVLHVAMTVRPDVPYGCTNGMCGTCRAKVIEGRVEMHHCYALTDAEVAAGFVLTCQARPRTDRVVLDYDA